MKKLKMPFESAGDYEWNVALHNVLEQISGISKAFCGKTAGDVTKIALESLDKSADALIAGPPCVAFSTIGLTLGALDPRSSIFVCVMHWAIYLATHGQLQFFVFENVMGILYKSKGMPPFADWVVTEFGKALPPGWTVEVRIHNAIDCRLPQNRRRVFIVGTSPRMRASRFQARILQQPLQNLLRMDITAVIDRESKPADFENCTLKQKMNILTQQDTFLKIRHDGSCDASMSEVAVIDASRDPTGSFDKDLTVGWMRTLRTNNQDVWLLPSGKWITILGKRTRNKTVITRIPHGG